MLNFKGKVNIWHTGHTQPLYDTDIGELIKYNIKRVTIMLSFVYLYVVIFLLIFFLKLLIGKKDHVIHVWNKINVDNILHIT